MIGYLISMFSAYTAVGTILMIAHRLLMALAINLDCRARNIGARRIFTVLSFFFPIVIGVIYCIRRKGLNKEYKVCHACGTKTRADQRRCAKCGSINLYEYESPKKRMLTAISIILCAASIISFAVYEVSEFDAQKKELEAIRQGEYDDEYEDEMDDEFYYDIKGIAHTDKENMLYYTKDDKQYTYDDVCNNEDAFVDEEGYLCFVKADDLTPVEDSEYNHFYLDENQNEKVKYVEFTDSNGKKYYKAEYIRLDYVHNILPN